MRKLMYSIGITLFLAFMAFYVTTSLTDPFYGMSLEALAQGSGSGGYDFDCSGSCTANCNTWQITYDVDCQGLFSGYHVKYFDSNGSLFREYNDEDNDWLIGDDPYIELGCPTENCV